MFRSLGFPSDYWQRHFNTLDKGKLYRPDPGIFGTLDRLRKRTSISLFTNGKPEENLQILSTVHVDPAWFKHTLSGDDIHERKPALDGFYAMIEKSHLPPGEILYVGDRVDVDIKPAKKVGMQTCLVWSVSKEADYSFERFEDILTIFP